MADITDIGRIQEVAERAQEAFWAHVAGEYPEITTGDFPPGATAAFDEACRDAVRVWVEGNAPDPLGQEAHLAVVDALRARGWEAHHEYPGMIGVTVGAFVLNLGMHAWDYGTPNVVVRQPDGSMFVDAFESAPHLAAGLDPEARDPDEIADEWSTALRAWCEEQRVKRDLLPAATHAEALAAFREWQD
jgi:hypothetical protein